MGWSGRGVGGGGVGGGVGGRGRRDVPEGTVMHTKYPPLLTGRWGGKEGGRGGEGEREGGREGEGEGEGDGERGRGVGKTHSSVLSK